MNNEGIISKIGDFLGIKKFGQGLATTARVLSGGVGRDIERQNQATAQADKILYAARQETDPVKRMKLLQIAKGFSSVPSAMDINSGLNLSNKEILGSAANFGLNILTPGAFRGGALPVLAKNAALGSAFGLASGLEKNRDLTGIAGSTVGGAVVGTALGAAGLGIKALKEFTTTATPKWLMDKAIKPTLDEARKSVKYGQKTFGEELLKEKVSGSPEKLLRVAEERLTGLEDELQTLLNSMPDARISKEQLSPYLKDLIEQKAGTPGLRGDVQRIKNVFDDIPETLSLQEANQMKRRIYNELRDVSYKLDAKLSTKGAALKSLASGLKQEIEKTVGGDAVQDINRRLSLYGRLENRIVDQLARNLRNNSFGLTDAILTSGGIASMTPVGFLTSLAGVVGRHVGGSTATRTTAARALNALQGVGTGVVGKTIKGVTRRSTLNLP